MTSSRRPIDVYYAIIARDKPELRLTKQQWHDLRCWAYTMVVYCGIVDRIADIVERAIHLGYWYAKQED